jgi:hypothetical protein
VDVVAIWFAGIVESCGRQQAGRSKKYKTQKNEKNRKTKKMKKIEKPKK